MSTVLTAPPTTGSAFAPANLLIVSEKNARKLHKARGIEALAASILKRGLLQNLVVSFDGTLYPVEGGERRRQAIQLLVAQGALAEDWSVPVYIIDASDSTAASATENMLRERMHPADEFEAFRDLSADGWTIDEIAESFGVTPLVVERRLALAKAAPPLLEALRRDEINTEQLAALCATDDHERQLAVWRGLPAHNRSAVVLRRTVLSGEVDVTQDARVRFIGGTDAFIVAGGEVRRDLFSSDGRGGFITDIALLEQLVGQKLDAAADEVRGEGWGWVEVWPEFNWSEYYRLGRLQKVAMPLAPDAEEKLAALHDERTTLEAEEQAILDRQEEGEGPTEADEERYDAVNARMEEILAEISAIEASQLAYEPEALAAAGAIVAREGHALRIERGLVRPGDRAKVAEASGGARAIVGGRETERGTRKAGELSDSLTRSLYGHRNLAAQTATAGAPRVAKVLLACWIVQSLRHKPGVPLDLRISEMGEGTRTQHPIVDETGEARRKAFDAIGTALLSGLPADPVALWDALTAAEDDVLDRLVAFAVASAVSLRREHAGLTAKLLGALQFDMADHFTPTAANYLGRIPKALIVGALADAGKISDDTQRDNLLGLKKADLAARAEAELAGTRWVPAAIRTPQLQVLAGGKTKAPRKASGRSEKSGAAGKTSGGKSGGKAKSTGATVPPSARRKPTAGGSRTRARRGEKAAA